MQNAYDHIAEQWHSQSRGQAYIDHVLRYVDLAVAGLQPGSRVLDLGCGTGAPVAKYLVEKGFRVTGVDQSEKMLEIAKREVPEAEFIHSDMINVELAPGFAAAIAWDSIFHVERKHHSEIFQLIADALEPGGRLLLSVGGSDAAATAEEFAATYDAIAEGFTSEMFGHTFFYSGYAPRVTRGLLEAAGFEIEVWEIDDPSSRGHIAVIAKKAA
jgi:cyclopropane fatty-acyl-phospholipid synthase-like methyltransferase